MNDSAEKERALEALYQVTDPELCVNVVDLGLIYDINFPAGNSVEVMMTLSTPHCPMGEAITSGVRNTLKKVFPGRDVHVALTYDPPWTFEMISEEGKRQLDI